MSEIKLENFSAGYKNKIIIDLINLSINSGEWLGIIGANGSGKSTLIKGICRIIKPHKGKVFLKGKDIKYLSNKSLSQKISFLPQGINSDLSISVSDLVRNRYQPRKTFDEESLEELTNSIKSRGIIQPIVARPTSGNKHEIIAGERRCHIKRHW